MKNLLFCFGRTKLYGEYSDSYLLNINKDSKLIKNLDEFAWYIISKYYAQKNNKLKNDDIQVLVPGQKIILDDLITLSVQRIIVEFEDEGNLKMFYGFKILYNTDLYFVDQSEIKLLEKE